MGAADNEFLGHLALDAVVVHRFTEAVLAGVHRVDVTADADGPLGHETFLPGAPATGVAQITARVVEDGVGDELLVRRVLLGGGPLHEMVGSRREHGVEVARCLRLEALKTTEFIKKAAGDDENVFHKKERPE